MRRIFQLLLVVSAIWSLPSAAQTAAYLGSCTLGGQATVTSGLKSTGTVPLTGGAVNVGAGVQASYPSCAVTVNLHGGGLATIFSNASNNPLANPFTANTDGSFTFYAAVASHYDITISGGTMPHSFVFTDVVLGGGGSGSSIALQTNGTPNGSQSLLNLKGGSNITLADDGVGGVTFSAPVTGNATSIQGNPIDAGSITVPGTFYAGITGTNHYHPFTPDRIDPRFYGAVCDNSTDDHTALQAMFDANPGGHFVLPGSLAAPAACFSSTSLFPKGGGFILEGGGSSSVGICTGGSCLRFPPSVAGLVVTQTNASGGGLIRNLTLRGGDVFTGAQSANWPDAILPNFVDQAGSFNPFQRSISTVTRSANVSTIQTTGIANEIGCHTFAPGSMVTVAGVADNSFNGLFYVTGISSTQGQSCFDTFTYANTGANGPSSGGTVSNVTTSGNTADGIVAGANNLRIENVAIAGFGRHAINCASDSGTYWCDDSSFKNIYAFNNRGFPLYVRGADSNASDFQQIQGNVNLSGGIVDLSFLGNLHMAEQMTNVGADVASTNGATKAVSTNTCASNLCTIVTSVAQPFIVGQVVVLAGQVDSTFNTPSGSGAFVTTVTDTTHFVVKFPHANGSTTGGTARLANGGEVLTAGGVGQNPAGTAGSGPSFWISGLNNTRTVLDPYCEGTSGAYKFGAATVVLGGTFGCPQAAGFQGFPTIQSSSGSKATNITNFDANVNSGPTDLGTLLTLRGGHTTDLDSSIRYMDHTGSGLHWMFNDTVATGLRGFHIYRGNFTNPRLDLYDPTGINSVPGWTVLSSEGNGNIWMSPAGTGDFRIGFSSTTHGGLKVFNNITSVASIDNAGKGTFTGGLAVSGAGGTFDLSAHPKTVPWITGTGAPSNATCTINGQAYFQTDGTAGQQVWFCNSGVWTLQNAASGAGSLLIPNDGGIGTILNSIATVTSAGNAITINAGANAGAVGIVSANAGTTGSATVLQSGYATLQFDNTATIGHYAGISGLTNGFATDAGASPTNVQTVGIIQAQVTLSPPVYTVLVAIGSAPPNASGTIVQAPGSTQTIQATAPTAIGLVVKQPTSGSVDIFQVLLAGGTKVFSVDSTGRAIFGTGTSNVTASSFTSASSNPAATGILRCASSDSCIVFRNNANNNDVTIGKNTSDIITVTNSTGFNVTQPGASFSSSLLFDTPAANRTIHLGDPGGNDFIAYLAAAQSFTNKLFSDQADFNKVATPANPPVAGTCRLYYDTGTTRLKAVNDLGGDCGFTGAGGASALSALTAAAGANTIGNGDFAQRWNWALTTAAKSGFLIGESAASTSGAGSQFLTNIQTLAASTAIPLQVTARGTANGFNVDRVTGTLNLLGAANLDTGVGNSVVYELPNDGVTGTTNGLIAKLTTSNTAIKATTADVSGVEGIVVAGGGTSGNAQIVRVGVTSCTFSNATTVGDWVGVSTATIGNCLDLGVNATAGAQIIGRVLTSGLAATSQQVLVWPTNMPILGTTNQVNTSYANATGLTLSLPQSINTGATVQFTGLTLGATGIQGVAQSSDTQMICGRNASSGTIGCTLTLSGANFTGTATQTSGSVLLKGGNNSSTSAGIAGNVTIAAGQATAAANKNGQILIEQSYIKGATFTTSAVQCFSADNTLQDCPTTSTEAVGIAITTNGNAGVIATNGSNQVTVLYDASVTPSAGWHACTSATVAGKVTAQSGACAVNRQVGIIEVGGAAVTSGVINVQFR